jgi:hypothetical protein
MREHRNFQSFIDYIMPQKEQYLRDGLAEDCEWTTGNLYTDAATLIEDLKTKGGSLPPTHKFYSPATLVIKGSDAYTPDFIFDVCGQSFDIGLVCEGYPEAWLCEHQIPTHKDSLTIRILHGASGGVDNLEATKLYAAICDLYTAALKKYRVRIVIDWNAAPSGMGEYFHRVTICDFADYLEPTTLVSLTSICMFRTIMKMCSDNNGHVAWPAAWRKYFNGTTTQVEFNDVEGGKELVLPPIHSRTFATYDLQNLLKAAQLIDNTEEGA